MTWEIMNRAGITRMAFPVAIPLPRPILRLHSTRITTTTRAAAARRTPSPQPLPDELQLVADIRSPHNHIRVADVSPRAAGHPFAGARLLLLDAPGNIHSVSFPRRPYSPLTSTYLDVFAALPPLLPRPSLAVLGFGAGSAARAILHFYPHISVHGWELDPSVIAVARDFFGLAELEKKHADRLVIHVGDALEADADAVPGGGFGGVLVDMFANGSVLRELQEAATWRRIGEMVAPGGRVMVNCGGGCVEAEEEGTDGEAVKDATLRAMAAAFGEGMVVVMDVDESCVAMTGPVVWAPAAWKARLPPELRQYVETWRPYNGYGDR